LRIRIRDLDFQYKKSPHLFKNITLEIPLNALVVVTGNSGSGKTTLLKLIAGLLEPDSGEIIFELDGKRREDIHFGYLFQNPDDQIVHFNIERELAFNLENRDVPPEEMFVRVENALREYSLYDRRGDSPNFLSGGEKQRLALAGMMISNPDILILDEPCSFLDINAQIQLYRRIAELRRRKVSIIWISQEIHEIQMADFVIELERGEVIWQGKSADYLKATETAYAE